jgi:preprotein translocase subunit SecD
VLHNLFQFGFAGLAGLCVVGALLRRNHRGSFLTAAVSAGSAAIAAHYGVFWALTVFALGAAWALFCATSYIDLAWRAKTGFVLALALGAALCIYPTYHDERFGREESPAHGSADEAADRSELEAQALRGDLGLGAFIRANIPFRLVRGLDLKGGLRLTYTVDVDEAIKDKRDRYYDEIRAALVTAFGFHTGDKDKPPTVDELSKLPGKVLVSKSKDQVGLITLTFTDPADSKKVDDEFLKRFLGELQLQRSADGKKVTFRIRNEVESRIRESAVSQAKETVRRRIDELGVKDPSLTVRDEDIIIEVPGEDEREFAKMRDTISQVARLEFKMVDDNTDFFADKTSVEDVKGLTFPIENAPTGKSATGEKQSHPVHLARLNKGEHETMQEALKRFKEWVSTLTVDPDHEIGFEKVHDYIEDKDEYEEVGWRTYYLFSKAEITGDMVREAQADRDDSGHGLGGWLVKMEMTPIGGDRFEDITGRNVNRRFAIILDGKVESAPVIITKIPGGHAQISMGQGNQDQQLQNAKKLEVVLKSGALPAPISPSNEQRIGATLGKDAVVQGGKGAIAGMILVLVFMVTYYSRAGMIANIAVLFNLVLQVAVLAMFSASMTLPGIAGLTLTVGIAVDANVLINERIREELRHGKSPRAAVDVGYDKAFSAIIDGHVTTLISGLILMQYGSGPIKGFAVTLFIGVLASLFTGVVCTRLMFDWAVRHRRVKNLHLG